MPFPSRVTMILAAVLGAGCSAPVVDDIVDASGGMTEGIVLIERVASGDGATQTNVSAKFMRLGAGADLELTERIVGSRLELPAAGECMVMPSGDVDEKKTSRASLGPIDLIDVGDVTVHIRASAGPSPGDATSMPLAARAFPDVGDLVSGVFYTSRDAQSDLPAGAAYAVEGSGSALVDHFSIEAEAPPAPEEVRIGDAPLREGVVLVEGASTTVNWQATPSPGSPRGSSDFVVIDVRGANEAAIRCTFKDEGEAVLPGAALLEKTLGTSSAASITFHRIRRRSFVASGVDIGELRFDLSVIGRVMITPRAP
jgi:hypothetical protein